MLKMAALRFSNTLMRRFACPAPSAFHLKSLTVGIQHRSFASTLPKFQQKKTEGGEAKKPSPFDFTGKVFVVTGTPCHSPVSTASTLLSLAFS